MTGTALWADVGTSWLLGKTAVKLISQDVESHRTFLWIR
jgi:hypothetical protein